MRPIRVGNPIDPSKLHEEFEREREARRATIDKLASTFIETGSVLSADVHDDFDLIEAVLREVASRLKEAVADPFLKKVLEAR